MRRLKKQIATRQKKLYALHQHVANKMHSYEDYGPSPGPASPFQITQWSKQFRQKAKKVRHLRAIPLRKISMRSDRIGTKLVVRSSKKHRGQLIFMEVFVISPGFVDIKGRFPLRKISMRSDRIGTKLVVRSSKKHRGQLIFMEVFVISPGFVDIKGRFPLRKISMGSD